MLGYAMVILGGFLLIAFVVAGFSRAGPRRTRPAGHAWRTQPSADAPTPDRSATAKRAQARAARRHTPPA